MNTAINKNDRRYQRTHSAIREAAFFLAEKNGWKKVSVTELSEKANINRNTFYLHYETIDDVFDETEKEIAEEYRAILKNEPVPEALTDESFFEKFRSFLEKQKETVLLISEIGRAEYLLLKLQEVWNYYFNMYFSNSAKSDKEKHIIIQYLSGSMYTFFSSWMRDPSGFDVKGYFFFEAEIINHLMRFSEEDK